MSSRKLSPIKLVLTLLFIGAVAFLAIFGQRIKERLQIYFQNPTYELTGIDTGEQESKINLLLGYKPAGTKALLPGATWVPQTFNNCGPATTSMLLQYFGHKVSQEETKAALRTNPTDTNVFSYEIADYLKSGYGIDSKLFYNGDITLLKTLIANGFYVMVEDWLHPNEDIGHTTILRGYDDEKGVFISDDSFIGVNITYKYAIFDEGQWKPFNREYLVLYRKEQEPILRAIIGENWDGKRMYRNAVKTNLEAVDKDPGDMYSWFNLGTSYYELGEYEKAKEAFEKSRAIGWPRRMLWYQIQPVQTYNELGEYQKALELAQIGLAANDSFSELHLESAISYKGLGNLDLARQEVQKALDSSPNYAPALEFAKSL